MDQRTQDWIVAMSLSDAAAADEGERRQPIVKFEYEETPAEFIHRRNIACGGKLRETVVEARRPTIQELMSQERRRLIRCGKLAN